MHKLFIYQNICFVFDHLVLFFIYSSKLDFGILLDLGPSSITLSSPDFIIDATFCLLTCSNAAIEQIKNKHYHSVLEDYFGEIILVEINYDSEDDEHTYVIE